MSWKATAWAKDTRGHKGLASKVLLLVLADYHDTERGYAWPSQQRLADDCEMSIRTVKYSLDWLEQAGFITTLQRGNQYQDSRYQLNFSCVSANIAPTPGIAPAPSYEGAIQGSATIAPASEGANGDTVKVQSTTSEGAIHVGTSLQEPSLEPPPPTLQGEKAKEVWPDWYATLYAIPGFKVPLEHCEAWLERQGITEDHAEITAYALKGKWPPSKDSKDPWATFQNWAKRPPFERSANGRPTRQPAGDPINFLSAEEYLEEDRRIAADNTRRSVLPNMP